MKIVIDIDEHIYKQVMADSEVYILDNEVDRILIENAIYNGTPLPKGHGRLIDADELKKHKYHDNHRFENAVAVAYIDWADTIIEADEEDEDGDSN